MKGLPGLKPGEIESHPGRPLEEHLFQTACLAEKIAVHYLGRVPENLRAACLLHDVAKAHAKFQIRLKKGKGRFPHAEPSAYIAFSISRDIMLAEVIRCHHTHIKNDFINDFWCNTDYENISHILSEIPLWPGSDKISGELGLDCSEWIDLLPSSEEWDELLDEIEDNTVLDANNWLNFKLLYSLLITADRLDAVGVKLEDLAQPVLNVPGDIIEKYLDKLKPTPLTPWRNQIRNAVLERAKTISGPGVYTLTLPTGTGKTLLSLDLALKIAHKEGKRGIIYVLPFITIVEQNSKVAKSIFPEVQEDHHLVDQGATEDMDMLQRFISLFRYWHEPVVISTFAKLWEVLYSPRGNASMSFHRLANSIVLLDEPQSIPARYWKGFGKTLELISSRLNTTFILITATQPGIARGKELAPPNISVPSCRYKAGYFNEPISIRDMLDVLVEHGLADRNTMIVANTRKAALETLFLLKEQKIITQEPFFLSSWVTPNDRKKIMHKIKTREEKQMSRYLVSTQVVEAGVDLDFELVCRDMAPLDSIVQVAGRCNRHMSDYLGQILIFEIIDNEGKRISRVYDSVLINFTREVLQNNKKDNVFSFNELEVPDLLEQYYGKLAGALENQGPWFDIQQGKWESWDRLIDEPVYECTVFIDCNGEIKSILEELKSMDNKLENKDRRRHLWRKVQEHAISVSKKELDSWHDKSGAFIIDDKEKEIEEISPEIWVINPKGIGRIYHPELGFVPLDIHNRYLANSVI